MKYNNNKINYIVNVLLIYSNFWAKMCRPTSKNSEQKMII